MARMMTPSDESDGDTFALSIKTKVKCPHCFGYGHCLSESDSRGNIYACMDCISYSLKQKRTNKKADEFTCSHCKGRGYFWKAVKIPFAFGYGDGGLKIKNLEEGI